MKIRNSTTLHIFILLIVVLFFCFPAYAKYGGGSGTQTDPYLIYTAEQMNEIGANRDDWEKHFKLMADIDLSSFTGTEFNIIGSYSPYRPFKGVFDGGGYVISNFTYDTNDVINVGLFGCISGNNTVIKDLGLVDPNIDAKNGYESSSSPKARQQIV